MPKLTHLELAPSLFSPQLGWGDYVPHSLKCLTLGVFDPNDIQDLEVLILPLAQKLELVRLYIFCKLDVFERACLDKVIVQLGFMGVEEIKVAWDLRVEEWTLRECSLG